MSWFKFYNLWRQPAPKHSATPDKYLPYGPNDRFPLDWSQWVGESPSGASCLSTVQDFLEGHGFSDSALEKIVINPKGETMWQLHQQTADSFAEFEGFAWLIRWNALGQITEIEFLPFENCRLGKPDNQGYISHIFYNPFYGTAEYSGENKKLTRVYDVYNPAAVPAQLLAQKEKYKGQVFWYGTTGSLSRFYPLPEAISAKKWMVIENDVSVYHEENFENGMLQRFIWVQKGQPNDPSNNPDFANHNGEGKPATAAQEFDQVMGSNFMGVDRHSNMIVTWASVPDEVPVIIPLPTNGNVELFNTLDNQATKKITIAWKVPAILANISEGVSLGGDGNAVRVAVKLMQQRVVKKQRILTDSYQKILSKFKTPYTQEITITPYNPYPEMEVLDDKVWNAMTADERRDWITKNTEILLSEEPDIAEPTAEPINPTAQFKNAIPISFNDSIKNTVKRAVEYEAKMGIKCSGKGGREVAQMIMDGKSMGLKQLKRIHNYLKKNDKYQNSAFNEGCDVILYHQWGGKPMFDYLEVKLKEFEQWLNKTN